MTFCVFLSSTGELWEEPGGPGLDIQRSEVWPQGQDGSEAAYLIPFSILLDKRRDHEIACDQLEDRFGEALPK